MHGMVRGLATMEARRGDPQGRLVADPVVRLDPIPFLEGLRAQGPLIRGRISFLTVEHGVAHELLRSDDFRVITLSANLPAPLRWLERRTRVGQLHPLRPPSLLAVEPPQHTRYRKSVSSVFTPRAVAALRARVEQTAHALLDQLAEDDPAGRMAVDIVSRYCALLPVEVISDILGVPERDRTMVRRFGEWAAASLDIGLSWPQYRQVESGLAGFNRWLDAHFAELRRNPGDNLMSELIHGADGEAPLSDEELRAIAGLVLAAGFETTVNLLGNGIRLLIDLPDQLAALRQRPELWPTAVEEVLRLDSPVQITARVATTDTEVAGTRVTRGEMVVLCLAAANRDPAVFVDPHRFDVTRDNAGRHLSFSGGRHFCLGAALARAEGEVGLSAFFDRFPEVRVAEPGTRRDTRVLRGWSRLPLHLGPARVRTGR